MTTGTKIDEQGNVFIDGEEIPYSDPRAVSTRQADAFARNRIRERIVSASAYEISAVAGRLMTRCNGSGDGHHEIVAQGDVCPQCEGRGETEDVSCAACDAFGRTGDTDAGVRAACVLCGLVIPLAVTYDQLDAARTIITATACPGCGTGRGGKKSGTHKSIQGVFHRHVFDCGSELTLTGFNHDGRGKCVRPDE